MLTLGRRLYFAASDATSGVELWSTDGTATGTHQVADIYPGALSSNPCQLTRMAGRIYFSATSALGTELWRSDGTAPGTWQVADLAPGDLSSFPSNLTAWHGDLYFGLADGSHGAQIWRSDGTAAGTKLFVDLVPGDLNAYGFPAGTLPRYLLLGSAVPDSSGFFYTSSLWSTDGSPGKLALLSGNYAAGPLTLGGTALFFVNEAQGVEPWITNGTVSGTRRLANISPDLQTYVDWLIPFGPGAAFTTLEGAPSGTEVLWRTDGTQSGTVRVGTIPIPSNEASYFDPTQRLAIGSRLFFVGTTPSTGDELWVYEHCFRAARYPDSGSTVCRHTPH
jgi:ELWxxDGT repeat protein